MLSSSRRGTRHPAPVAQEKPPRGRGGEQWAEAGEWGAGPPCVRPSLCGGVTGRGQALQRIHVYKEVMRFKIGGRNWECGLRWGEEPGESSGETVLGRGGCAGARPEARRFSEGVRVAATGGRLGHPGVWPRDPGPAHSGSRSPSVSSELGDPGCASSRRPLECRTRHPVLEPEAAQRRPHMHPGTLRPPPCVSPQGPSRCPPRSAVTPSGAPLRTGRLGGLSYT